MSELCVGSMGLGGLGRGRLTPNAKYEELLKKCGSTKMVLSVWKDEGGENGSAHHSCADHGEAATEEGANVSEN